MKSRIDRAYNPVYRHATACMTVALMFSLLSSSCDLFGSLAKPENSGAAFVQFLEPVNGAVDLSVFANDSGRSAYVVFTTGDANDRIVPGAEQANTATRVPSHVSTQEKSLVIQEWALMDRRARFKEHLTQYQPVFPKRLSPSGGLPASDQAEITTGSFTVYVNSGTTDYPVYQNATVPATCRYASGSVDFGARSRSLSIWVADDSWVSGGNKTNLITQTMVNAMVESFFGKDGAPESSIYAWVTGILGDEWGPAATFTYAGYDIPLIDESDNVTILLADIYEQDADNGGVVGYFYSGDLIPGGSDSNERVMFAIDSVMYANPSNDGGDADTEWTVSDYWPSTIFSTLAHEFQHMIHFYQKSVVAGADQYYEPVWVDELCSMQIEDLIADKMGVQGPRGVDPLDGSSGSAGNDSGRMPDYLLYPDISLSDWGGVDIYASYANAYSFGAYLTRNFGGARFIRDLVQSSRADESSVVAAASSFSGREESMESLLRRWGAAVLLSVRTDAPEGYRYNTGGFFTADLDGVAYNLGSINFYNYAYSVDVNEDGQADGEISSPYVFEDGDFDLFSGGAYSNAFMYLGDPSRKPGWSLTVPDGMVATIVVD